MNPIFRSFFFCFPYRQISRRTRPGSLKAGGAEIDLLQLKEKIDILHAEAERALGEAIVNIGTLGVVVSASARAMAKGRSVTEIAGEDLALPVPAVP